MLRITDGEVINLSRKQVVRRVASWIRERRPGAIVRFGEGEGRLLVASPDDPPSINVAVNKLQRQTGLIFSTREMFNVRSLVLKALDTADIVGIRGSDSFSDEHKMWVGRIEALFAERAARRREPAYVTHCLVNNQLRDALPQLLAGQRFASVISSRDVRGALRDRCGVEDIKVYQVPSQYITRGVDGAYEAELHGVPMWPDFYCRLREVLTVREPGEVVLVGAGVFGKDLCIRVRELGGIAVDLGSCLDGLAGKATRGERRPSAYPLPPEPQYVGSERRRIAAKYARYRTAAKRRAWSAENPGNRRIREELVAAIAERVSWPPSGSVLDAGCGTGWWLERLAAEGVPHQRLYGVDILEERVAATRKRVPGSHVASGDVRALPFLAGGFAFVSLFTVLTSLASEADMERALNEAVRVLAPGGVLAVWDLRTPRPRRPRRVPYRVLANALGQRAETTSLTLLPPLARRLGPMTPTLYPHLARVRPLRTHRLTLYHAGG